MLFFARKVNCIVGWCIAGVDADGKADEKAQGDLCGCGGVA